jgi:transcriptional regulator with XRE-family HTH domain
MTTKQPKAPLYYQLRKDVLGVSQAEFATMAGVEQSTVSRWERGEFEPNLATLRKLRASVVSRGHVWDDAWLFEVSTRGDAA